MQVLVVAAHPDDDVLGCGATIAKHALNGDSVDIAFLSDGVSARDTGDNFTQLLSARREAASEAAHILGANLPMFGEFPDNQLDAVPLIEVVRTVENLADSLKPELVYTHHWADLNVDHRLSHEAVMTAFRPQSLTTVQTILCFETPSSTEWRTPNAASSFVPTWFVDVSATLQRKREALSAYSMEMREFPHPRSWTAVEALAQWRGASVGHLASEAFCTARHLV